MRREEGDWPRPSPLYVEAIVSVPYPHPPFFVFVATMAEYTTLHCQKSDVDRIRRTGQDLFGTEVPPRIVINRLIEEYKE